MKDRFDLRVATASQQACDNYVAGVDLLLSANPGADERLAAAIAADPEFALAHVARARLLQLQARMPEARDAAARSKSLCGTATVRERRHVETIALAVSLALGVFGLLGFSGRVDHHEAQLALLQELAPHWGNDWWFLGYLGWAYIETGEVAKGTRLVERSLAR